MHSDNFPRASYSFEGYSRFLKEDRGGDVLPALRVVAPDEKILDLLEAVSTSYGERVNCLLGNSFGMRTNNLRFARFSNVPQEELMSQVREFQDVLLHDDDTAIAISSSMPGRIIGIDREKVLTICESTEGETDDLLRSLNIPHIQDLYNLTKKTFRPRSNMSHFKRYAHLTAGVRNLLKGSGFSEQMSQ